MKPRKHFRLALLLGLLSIAAAIQGCTPSPDCSITEYVPTRFDDATDGICDATDCTLREAVLNANYCPGHQTIRLPAGSYMLSISGANEDLAETGDLDITDDLTIIGEGAPFINGGGIDRIFEVFSPAVVDMETLLISNGLAQHGGGINNHGELTLTGVVVTDCVAQKPEGIMGFAVGGGIYNDGTLNLLSVQVRENSAMVGGGVAVSGSGVLNMSGAGSMLVGNTATDSGGGLIIGNTASATIEGVEVWRNEAYAGAGICNNGNLEMHLGNLYENIALDVGGGLQTYLGATSVVYDSSFNDNTAEFGGGVFNAGLTHLYRSGVTNNSALSGFGGGIYNDGAFPGVLLRNVTVSGNTIVPSGSPGGAGIYNHGADLLVEFATIAFNDPDGILNDSGGHLTLESTILSNHTLVNCTGVGTPSNGYNLEADNTCGLIEASDLTNTDPLLAPLALNGGTSLNHALNPGSPAIDSGDPDTCTSSDQRSVARPQGLGCDRGAHEVELLIPLGTLIPETLPTIVLPSPTPTPTPTERPSRAEAVFIMNANCRRGPGTLYDVVTSLLEGQRVLIEGRSAPGLPLWWWILLPNSEAHCWVSDTTVEASGSLDDLQVIPAPPTPTPKPPPQAPTNLTIADRTCNEKVYLVSLQWVDQASNEDGFRVYRNGTLIATLPANSTSYQDNPPYGGPYTYAVEAFNSSGSSSQVTVVDEACSTRQ